MIHPLEGLLGIQFKQADLLKTALTHRSYLNENRTVDSHNERLEFLGDAVLELVVTNFLYQDLPDLPEGELTAIRAALVRKENLHEAALKLSLGDYLFLSKGEEQTGGRANGYLLANALEALLGALYLDQGIAAASQVITEYVLPSLRAIISGRLHKDAKSQLQEIAQERLKLTPTYQVIKESGPDHDKQFESGAYFNQELQGRGGGNSKRAAEIAAAADALGKLGW